MTNENRFRIGQKVVYIPDESYSIITGLYFSRLLGKYMYSTYLETFEIESNFREATPEEIYQYYL